MKEKLDKYNYEILLDDDHKILKETQKYQEIVLQFFIFLQRLYSKKVYLKNIGMGQVWTN